MDTERIAELTSSQRWPVKPSRQLHTNFNSFASNGRQLPPFSQGFCSKHVLLKEPAKKPNRMMSDGETRHVLADVFKGFLDAPTQRRASFFTYTSDRKIRESTCIQMSLEDFYMFLHSDTSGIDTRPRPGRSALL